jgi:hypothetical protein
MATNARFRWPPPRGFVSAYAQNLMAADTRLSKAEPMVSASVQGAIALVRKRAHDQWSALLETAEGHGVDLRPGTPR